MIISLIVFYQLAGVIVFKSEVYRVIYLIVVKFKMIPLGDFVLIGAKAGLRGKKKIQTFGVRKLQLMYL